MENPFEIIDNRLQKIEAILREHCKSPAGYAPVIEQKDPLMTIKQASAFLDITVSYLYKKTSQLEIPFNKKGKRIYFLESELREWIRKGRIKTVEEIDEEVINNMLKSRRKK